MSVPRLCYYSLPNCQGSEKNDVGMGTFDRQLPTSHLWRNQPRSLSLEDSGVRPQGSTGVGKGERGCSLREKESQRVGKWGVAEERAEAGTAAKICQCHACFSLLEERWAGHPCCLENRAPVHAPRPRPAWPRLSVGT